MDNTLAVSSVHPWPLSGVRDIWLGFQGSPPDGGLIAGTHGVLYLRAIPQGFSSGQLDMGEVG